MSKKQIAPEDLLRYLDKLVNEEGFEPTDSQKRALSRLKALADVKYAGIHELAGVATRPVPLLVGASGSGKTALVREFSRQEDLPLFALNVTSWIPIGAKHEEYSLIALRNFIDQNKLGVIFLDELNKLRTSYAESQGWYMSVMTEVMMLLDGDTRLLQSGFSEGQIEMLKRNFFVIGAGAWQEQWSTSKERASVGFGGSPGGKGPDPTAFLQLVKSGDIIPQELLFRFNERLILLEAPTESELAVRIAEIRNEDPSGGVCDPEGDEVLQLAREAARSECPMRWLEAFAGDTIAERPQDEIRAAACEQKKKIRAAKAAVRYDLLYNSTVAIFKRLAYDVSLAAQDLIYCLQGDRVSEAQTRNKYLSDTAQVSRQFSLPIISDVERRELFDKAGSLVAKASCEFRSLMNPDGVECLRDASYQSLRKFLLVADQLNTEYQVVRKVMLEQAALAESKIKDRTDDRQEWIAGRV